MVMNEVLVAESREHFGGAPDSPGLGSFANCGFGEVKPWRASSVCDLEFGYNGLCYSHLFFFFFFCDTGV
jgi:hypothetical protein